MSAIHYAKMAENAEKGMQVDQVQALGNFFFLFRRQILVYY